MKTSELIQKLTELHAEFGDLPVKTQDMREIKDVFLSAGEKESYFIEIAP